MSLDLEEAKGPWKVDLQEIFLIDRDKSLKLKGYIPSFEKIGTDIRRFWENNAKCI